MAGRVAQETEKTVVIVQNPFLAGLTTTINKADIKSRELSKVSPMPPGPASTRSRRRRSSTSWHSWNRMGDPKHPDFSK
jgi:hypothetical protein